jgi:glycosyltransferase involved in cell wall biosynthesis
MLDLIAALGDLGVESRVVVPARGYVTQHLEQRGIPYEVRRYWTWTSVRPRPWWARPAKPFLHWARSRGVAAALKSWRCDVVVTNTLTVCEGALAARSLGLPHVTHVREFGDLDHGWSFEVGRKASMRILASLSAAMVFNSQAVARHHGPQVRTCPTAVVPNAVPVAPLPARRARRGDRGLRCLMVGTLAPSKGQGQAIRALHEITKTRADVSLTLVGDGPPAEVERLQSLAKDLGVAGLVHFTGRADPVPHYAEADVLLMCSRNEAFGRVTAEAMAWGLPVIGARSGGTPELVQEGRTGLLYESRNEEDLARCMLRLAEDPDLARRFGQAGRAWAAEHLSPDRCARDFLRVLEQATSQGPGRRRA